VKPTFLEDPKGRKNFV
jgi:hypothetical protein